MSGFLLDWVIIMVFGLLPGMACGYHWGKTDARKDRP